MSEHSTRAPAAFPSVADARRAVSLFARPILRRTVATLGGALVVRMCGAFEPLLLKRRGRPAGRRGRCRGRLVPLPAVAAAFKARRQTARDRRLHAFGMRLWSGYSEVLPRASRSPPASQSSPRAPSCSGGAAGS